ncbi:MAG: STAS domain-containing protein [Chromatiales bacterium]|nr:STAS domain-containing protein [Chromatiales bacterium]
MRRLSSRLFPFVGWFPVTAGGLRADLMAGLAVALVLIPQSMAYAQLAQLPPIYGLYAAFLPVMVAALWGSSSQLATGPVAVVSLLTGTALLPFAAAGSPEFIALAIALAALIGVIQLLLGLLRMGVLVSFISHPVVIGFTNAAALIIALSQLNKLLGLQRDTESAFLVGIWDMLLRIGDSHVPTVMMGVGAIALMWLLKKYLPRAPGVLIAVVLSILISWLAGFERKTSVSMDAIATEEVRALIEEKHAVKLAAETREEVVRDIDERLVDITDGEALMLQHQRNVAAHEAEELREKARLIASEIRRIGLQQAAGGVGVFYAVDVSPTDVELDKGIWRFVGTSENEVTLSSGGAVVGTVPRGLPDLAWPSLDWQVVTSLITSAFIIAMVGFTEAIAIAKAMAAKTGQRIDPNQELIGQGLANMVGSISQAYPVSGSFSRSAVNLSNGARTGLSSVFTALIVLVTLLFLTSLLYHLPQAVLAAIIMMAVSGLVNVKAVKHAWQASRHDGLAAIVTFVVTLVLAPNLEFGILAGVGLAVALYLYRTMRPRVAELARYQDGTLRDARLYGLAPFKSACIIRFDGGLFFANVPYFEDAVLNAVARNPEAKYVVIVGKGINEVDASGEEVIRHLVRRLRERDVTLVFAGIKAQVLDVMQRTGLYEEIGEKYVFRSTQGALDAVAEWTGDDSLRDAKSEKSGSGHPVADPA